MRWSRSFIPTLREAPADAELASHKLLIRGGLVRQMAPGICSYLPLGLRAMSKIGRIVRDEMNAAAAQEFLLPALHPADPGPDSLPNNRSGDSIFSLKDRAGRDLYLNPYAEELFADLARRELRSYKDLPQTWYQIQAGFRDETPSKSGLLGLRQFIACSSCSFAVDEAGLDFACRTYQEICCRILFRCGLKWMTVNGGMAGKNHVPKFMIPLKGGDHDVAACACGYAADLETAGASPQKIADPPADRGPVEVHTPGRKTIAEIADFLGVPPARQIKSLVYVADSKPCLLLVRGDRQLSEAKLAALMNSTEISPALPEEIRLIFGAEVGSLGPVGVSSIPVYADFELQGRENLTCGANRTDYHLQGVAPGVHFSPSWADLRTVEEGDICLDCGKPLDLLKASEIGRITKPATRHSGSLGAVVLNASGNQIPVQIGCCVIGLDRILASAVEQHHDEDGIVWPVAIAPFSVIITPVNYRDETAAAANRLYADLEACGVDVLLDDRPERPGVKFKDADLIGIPYRIVVGAQKLAEGRVELFSRDEKRIDLVALEEVGSMLKMRIAAGLNKPVPLSHTQG